MVRYNYYLKYKTHYNLQSISVDIEQKEGKNPAKTEEKQSEGHRRRREDECCYKSEAIFQKQCRINIKCCNDRKEYKIFKKRRKAKLYLTWLCYVLSFIFSLFLFLADLPFYSVFLVLIVKSF